ncbi:MAG: hypothetical protein J5918_04310 [Prevotella sp.]|nr:hypothetical protein [Prevotella sp.]
MRLYCKPILLFITLFFTITSLYAQSADDAPFVLVTDYSTLEDGDEILLVNEKDSRTLGAQSTNNRLVANIVIEGCQINEISSEVEVVTLKSISDKWYLKVKDGFLVAVADKNDKNKFYLRTQNQENTSDAYSNTMASLTMNNNNEAEFAFSVKDAKNNKIILYLQYKRLNNQFGTGVIPNVFIKIYRKLKNIVTVDYDENDEGIKAKLSENLNKENVTVNLKRNFKADGGWYSLCLPFDVSADNMKKIFGESVSVQEFASASGDEGVLMVNFTSTENGIKAGKPYLIKPSKDAENPVFKRIVITKDEPEIVEQAGYKFIGIFAPFELKAGDKTCRFLNGADGTKLDYPSVTENLKGTRAYFKFPSSSAQSAASAVTDDVASVKFVVNGNKSNKTKIYKLDGTELNENQLVKGIYIVGDKKVLIK